MLYLVIWVEIQFGYCSELLHGRHLNEYNKHLFSYSAAETSDMSDEAFWHHPSTALRSDFSQVSLGRFQSNFFVTYTAKHGTCVFYLRFVNFRRKLYFNCE